MTRFLLLFLTLCLLPGAAAGEPKEPTAEMLKELQEFKIKYLIQEMGLPEDKQDDFTRLYTQYDNERSALFRDVHRRSKAIRKSNNPTDTDYLIAAENMATAKSREGELEKAYFGKFKSMLSPKQLYTLKRAEHKFNRKLREMKKKGKGPKHKKAAH